MPGIKPTSAACKANTFTTLFGSGSFGGISILFYRMNLKTFPPELGIPSLFCFVSLLVFGAIPYDSKGYS